MAHPFEFTHEIEVDASPRRSGRRSPPVPASTPGSWAATRSSLEWAARPVAWAGRRRRRRSRPGSRQRGSQAARRKVRTALHAFEYLVEGRDQGSTVVRWVHSGFLGENWEKEYEGLSEGDPMYFDKLRIYVTYFRGRTATPVNVFGPVVPDRDEAWKRYHEALGLSGPVALGDPVHLTPDGLAELDGVVDWLSRDFLGVRTDDGIYQFMHISVFGGPTGVGHHLFVDGLDQAETEGAWEDWLTKVFPS